MQMNWPGLSGSTAEINLPSAKVWIGSLWIWAKISCNKAWCANEERKGRKLFLFFYSLAFFLSRCSGTNIERSTQCQAINSSCWEHNSAASAVVAEQNAINHHYWILPFGNTHIHSKCSKKRRARSHFYSKSNNKNIFTTFTKSCLWSRTMFSMKAFASWMKLLKSCSFIH